MEINSVFYYQPENFGEKNVVVCNGQIAQDETTWDRGKDFVYQKMSIFSEHSSPWCEIIGDLFYLKGTMSAKDEAGRFLCFLFVAKVEDYQSMLDQSLKMIGKDLDSKTKNCLAAYGKEKPSLTRIIVLGLVVLLLLVIVICVISND